MDRINKNYYYNLSQETFKEVEKLKEKPRLLLHSCCAPCNSYVMIMLSEYFDLTLLYNNSNIYPESEYKRRVQELIDYTESVNEKFDTTMEVVEFPYDSKSFHEKLAKVNDHREGGSRCKACYTMRMDEAYQYALDHDFDYFTTVMSISRQKNSVILNEIGESLNDKYKSNKYLFSDFKKKNGLLKSKALIDEFDMYRQQYCGCAFSYQDYLKRVEDDETL